MKLTLTKIANKILKEDINIRELHPDLIGFYVFLQTINKVANESPYPIPTVNIIPDYSLRENPGPFSFSRSSFKIKINPKIGELDFDDAGHDIFHALTTNLAKHFARIRPSNEKSFLSHDGASSKFNRPVRGLKEKMNTKLVNRAREFGFQIPPGIENDDEALLHYLMVLGAKARSINSDKPPTEFYELDPKIGTRKILQWKQQKLEKLERLQQLKNFVNDLRYEKAKAKKAHFQRPVYVKDGAKNPSSRIAYLDTKSLDIASDYGSDRFGELPQYDIEEEFGNLLLAFFEDAIKSSDFLSSPVDFLKQNFDKQVKPFPKRKVMIEKFKDFLELFADTYNNLLPRYAKAVLNGR